MRGKVILAMIKLLHKRLFLLESLVRRDGSMSHLNKEESLNANYYRVSV